MIGRVKPLRELAERLLNECATIDTPLFGHSDSKRTSRTFKKYVRLALPEREDIHLHSLRHTCCIELLRNGVPYLYRTKVDAPQLSSNHSELCRPA